jgi:hypothetical protein
MIHTESFPGWESFGAFVSHLKFVGDHHRQIERIAAVTNSGFLRIMHASPVTLFMRKSDALTFAKKIEPSSGLKRANRRRAGSGTGDIGIVLVNTD